MSAIAAKLIAAAVLFLVIVSSGLWLTRLGKPLNTAIMTVHKLAALGTLIFVGVTVYRMVRDAGMGALEVAAVAVSGVLALLLFGTGVWLSFGRPVNTPVLAFHKIAPALSLAATAATVYLLAAAG